MTPQQGTFRVSTDFEIPVLDMSSRWQWFKLTGQESGTQFRWVCGLAQLADTLTKYNDRKPLLQFLSQRQFWKLVRDETFTAGRKMQKKTLERKLREDQEYFVAAVKDMADKSGWPWIEDDGQYHPFT